MDKYIVICFVCLGSSLTIALLVAQRQIEIETGVALWIGLILLTAVLRDTITRTADGIDLSISNLPALYGFSYALYYLNGLVLFSFRSDAPKDNIIEISTLMFLGYLGWRSGLALSGASKAKLCIPVFGYRKAASLLILCWLGFGLVMVGYGYRASVGAFYSHGVGYTQEATLVASFLQNVTFPFEFPAILLTALLSAAGRMRKQATISLCIFGSILCMVHLLAGEFRWIVTDVVLGVAVLQFAAGLRLTWHRVAAGTCVCVVVLLLIQGGRIVAEARGGGAVGAMESVSLLVDGATTVTDDSMETEATARTSERGSESMLFLSTLIDRVKDGAPYIYWKVMLDELSSVVPRAMWPDKPMFLSTQILIKREFGLPERDDSPGPLISYYGFGGPLGVFCWLLLFGLFLGRLQCWAARGQGLLPWLVLIWVLGAAVSVETDQVLGVVTALRHCFVAYIVVYLIVFFYPKQSPRSSSVGVAYPRSKAAL
jgi:hypothetical protein